MFLVIYLVIVFRKSGSANVGQNQLHWSENWLEISQNALALQTYSGQFVHEFCFWHRLYVRKWKTMEAWRGGRNTKWVEIGGGWEIAEEEGLEWRSGRSKRERGKSGIGSWFLTFIGSSLPDGCLIIPRAARLHLVLLNSMLHHLIMLLGTPPDYCLTHYGHFVRFRLKFKRGSQEYVISWQLSQIIKMITLRVTYSEVCFRFGWIFNNLCQDSAT